MKMTDEDIKKYPKLRDWLYGTFCHVSRRKPKVYDAYLRQVGQYWSSFDWALRDGLIVGAPPWLIPSKELAECQTFKEPVGNGQYIYRRQIPWYGFTPPNRRTNKILVAEDLV